MTDRPVLMFDSGVGGLTVLREARVLMPDRRFVYVADDAAFPYGAWEEAALRRRIVELFGRLLAEHAPEVAVIACNDLSPITRKITGLLMLRCSSPRSVCLSRSAA